MTALRARELLGRARSAAPPVTASAGRKEGTHMPVTHILVPTDFSDTAAQALRYAFDEARVHGAKVTLLHVVAQGARTDVYHVGAAAGPPGAFDPAATARLGAPWPSPPTTVVRHDMADVVLTRLQDLLPYEFRHQWGVELAAGAPAETIVRIAQEQAADLIVMGTHGRTGIKHALLGSVAEKVVRLAPCPVLTVRDTPHVA